MPIRISKRCTIALAASVLAIGVVLTEPAAAQLFFDWGGGHEKPNDSGRIVGRLEGDAKPGEIIVSFGDRRLYHVTAAGQAVSYPIAIPREQDRWQGKTTVTQKRENPSWTPTPTMLKENPKLPRWVPGGHPMNPLGVRALYLGSSFYRIHGTDAPWTIGSAVSKGCIRMYNKDAQDLYEQVKVGARVLVTWNTYKFTPNPGQPQLPEPKEEQVAAAAAPAQAQTAQSAQPAQAAEAAVDQPARFIPAQFTNPFESGPEYVPSRKGRAERAEQAPAPEAAPAGAAAQPARTTRPRPNANANAGEGEGRPRASRPDAQMETGSLGERRQQQRPTAKAKSSPAAASASEGPSAQASETPPAAASPVAAAAPAASPDNSTADIAAKALAAAERAAAAAERAAAAAERAERASAARASSTAPAAQPQSVPAGD